MHQISYSDQQNVQRSGRQQCAGANLVLWPDVVVKALQVIGIAEEGAATTYGLRKETYSTSN